MLRFGARRRTRLADGGNTSQTRGERRHGRVNASLAMDGFSKILGNHSVCFIYALFCTNIPEEMRTKSRLSCNFPQDVVTANPRSGCLGSGGPWRGSRRSVSGAAWLLCLSLRRPGLACAPGTCVGAGRIFREARLAYFVAAPGFS